MLYRVLIRRDIGGTAQERMHTNDRATAVRYYRKLLPTGGYAKILTVEIEEQQVVVETTRYVEDAQTGVTIPVASPGEAFEGFDWTETKLSPSMDSATEVRGDPYSLRAGAAQGSQRRAELLGKKPAP
jgi:hypothetical protein